MRIFARGPVVLATLVLIVSACGGGNDSSKSESSASSSSSTTSGKSNAADAETIASTQQATLLAGDYPQGWKVQTEAAERPVSNKHCEYADGGPYASLRDGAVQNGPTMQLGESPGFVSSRALVFPDEAAATQFIATLDSKGWETCEVQALNDFQKQQKSTSRATIETREAPGLGTEQFESYALLQFADPAKPDNLLATFEMSAFQWGRVVVMVFVEQQFLEPDAQTTFDAERREALVTQFARLTAATSTE